MQIKILVFGQLTDIFNSREIRLGVPADTNNLQAELHTLYPELADKKYLIAVDKQTISSNTTLTEGCTVALLPPLSGG